VAQAKEAASLSREHCGGGERSLSPPSRRRFTEERELPAAPPARKRKSRWGDSNTGEEGSLPAPSQPGLALPTALGQPALAAPAPARPPALVAYATRVFGSTATLTEAQWKQCEQQLQLGAVYGELAAKQARAAAGKQMKFEYDSDEDTEGGTWEHKARQLEMEKTQSEAERSNQLLSAGTSHIGDFLPPEEFNKFMSKYKALQSGVPGDTSAFQENKLTEENKGFKMLQKMGWSEGAGLGAGGSGIVNPIGKSEAGLERMGLGLALPGQAEADDDDVEQYRKRMMLAYKFRPNPMNNPRRQYY